MKEEIKQITSTKQFNIIMIFGIIVVILAVAGLISLRYNVEGESNLPFDLTKVTVISSAEGNDNEDLENKWNLTVDQNNDVYLYIEKNSNYKETEAIDSIVLDNFTMKESSQIGEKKLYKADANAENSLFKNVEENEVDSIEYIGSLESDIRGLEISNQGGLIVFRYSIIDVGNYVSNDDEEINHNELLKKLNIDNEDLKFVINFDIIIKLKSDKIYKSSVELELPIGNVVENGTENNEITELNGVIFKRVNNE